jgi:hypothetical protein
MLEVARIDIVGHFCGGQWDRRMGKHVLDMPCPAESNDPDLFRIGYPTNTSALFRVLRECAHGRAAWGWD